MEELGSCKERLLQVKVGVRKAEMRGEMEVAWGEWVNEEDLPGRSLWVGEMVVDGQDVQIDAVAAVNADSRKFSSSSSSSVGDVRRIRGERQVLSSEDAAKAVGPYVQGVKVENGTIYASGCIGLDPKTGEFVGEGVEEQTRGALRNAMAILKEGGATLKDVVRTMVLLKDIRDFGKVNQVYKEFFEGDDVPARSCFAAADLPKDALVEIECTAIVPT